MIYPGKSHFIISTIPYWLYRPALFRVGSDDAKGFMSGGKNHRKGGTMWFQFSVVSGGSGIRWGCRVPSVSELRHNCGSLFMSGKGEPPS